MAFKIRGKIDGFDDVMKRLDGIDKKVKKKALRKAAGAVGTIILKAAKSKVRKKTGLLRRSLGKKIKVYSQGVGVAVVGPRVGYRQEVVRDGKKVLSNPTKYAHLVELGTVRSKPYPFLSAALEATRKEVREAVASAILEAVGASQ